jgi:arylsulfatase A-like enzyme
MVHAVDRNVGRVMAKLHELGLAENTLTIFLNDNGGGGNNAAVHTRNTAINRPHRGHKRVGIKQRGVRAMDGDAHAARRVSTRLTPLTAYG